MPSRFLTAALMLAAPEIRPARVAPPQVEEDQTPLHPGGEVVEILLADHEWGNELMREVARDWFARHPLAGFVLVREHAGWFLGFRPDLSCWASANDAAAPDGGPRPIRGLASVLVRRVGLGGFRAGQVVS